MELKRSGSQPSQKPPAEHTRGSPENGVTLEEIVAMITHLAFYVGRPNAMSAVNKAKPANCSAIQRIVPV